MDRFCWLCFMLVCVVPSCLFLVALWPPAGKGLTSWLSCWLCFVAFPNVSWSTSGSGWRRETGLSPLIKYSTDHSKAVLFCGSFVIFMSCVLCFLVCTLLTCGDLLGKG